MRCVYSYVEDGRIVIEAPPKPPVLTPANPMARLLPVAMIAAMAGMTLLYLTSTDSTARSPMFLFFPAMMLVSLIGTLVHGGRGAGGGDLPGQRAEYLRYLDTLDGALAEAADRQHDALHQTHPHPAALWTLVGGERTWERAEDHPDFCAVRVGLGARPATITVVAPELGAEDEADPVTTGAVRRLMDNRAVVRAVPVSVPLRTTRVLVLTGDPDVARAVARALVCQLAVLHHPDLVSVSAAAPHDWDWLKWLPHHAVGARHRVVIADGGDQPAAADGETVIAIRHEDGAGEVAVHCDGERLTVLCDQLSLADAVACARRLARHRRDLTATRRVTRDADWSALMGITDPGAVDVDRMWSRGRGSGLLRVPIGVADDGAIVELDIKEAAAQGMGPHGLCVGATGSGKSEFLRTLVLGMIATHPPDVLNLVLVDFKGGATFLGIEKSNHVSAVITNLADEAPLVARMREALSGEVNRRQEILRAAGNLTSIDQYRRACAGDRTRVPLPALFIIVDEFSELLSQHPDFAELFVAIGRLGRSLGMHLLLASQRLDEGRLRGLETHLSYRVCLKTFSASESRAVLGVPDAYHLSSEPGAAYLATAAGTLTRFQTAYVSGGYVPAVRPAAEPATVRPFTLAPDDDRAMDLPAPSQGSLLEAVLAQLAGRGAAAHRVWLPPLRRSPELSTLLSAEPVRHLRVPIGVVDSPFEQRRDLLIAELGGAAGNVAVVGAPRSGKSTALQTLVGALAATHDAGAAQFYCLDFGGGALSALRGFPHVGSVAGRGEPDLCRRTVAQLESVLRDREAAGSRDGDAYGDVFLVVDGWATLRQEFDGLESAVTALAAQGLAYGIHVVIAAARWADLRPALKDQIGTRIELRLGDPTESEMDRRRAKDLADRPAGRGITRDGRELAIARPDLDPARVVHHGPRALPVELLPGRVEQHLIAAAAPAAGRVAIGLGERDLRPVVLDFAAHPHLLVLGDGECGKTSLLRLLCRELAASPDDLRLEIVDYRRTLLGVVESGHRTGYAVSGAAVASRLAAVSEILDSRMPDEHVTQRQLKNRSWWQGPDIYLVVDDYDLVAGATGNPLTPLADFLPHARDLGLHLIVARRSGGAARAMFDPVLARMRDMGCAGFMMSAAPEEGVLLGSVRPTPLPPGRGTLIVRGGPDELVQVGWVEPP
ncbi:type VII secretion protein EccCa/type VII secretion protein EccCb [Mycolicibacterium aurum]|uniref:Type VII secretion protein EccCa/type VII secretion protein EccCb n=2 Tax=Mycolicibacterium aurum TaxID=1791 RepID=A0A448II83_MYCAU|nr:type VII secretion protein EccCa/type VII secretion protein EccCb [Mycolicibacterium aurum]